MRILAIETVETSGSVAALRDEVLLVERQLAGRRRSAQSLAPTIAELLAEAGWRPGDVELVAVATGPGSFTGLRIGVTTAKAFAYAVGCQILGVHSLLAIASRVPDNVDRCSVVIDAQRNELFVADFSRTSSGQLTGEADTRTIGCDAWLGSLTAGDVVTGSGLARVADRLPQGVTVIDQSLWTATAGAVGRVAWQRYTAGERCRVFDLVPQYFRRSAAEEKRDSGAPS